MKKRDKDSIYNERDIIKYLIVGLIVILALTLTISIAYFSRRSDISGTITVGEIDFSVYENNVDVGYIVPGDTVNKEITVVNSRNIQGTNTRNLGSLLFKFSYQIFLDDEYDENLTQQIAPIINDVDFTESDGEFYFNNVLNKGESINLCSYFNFDTQINNTYQDEDIYIVFQIDAIQAENEAYLELWPDAPEEWIEIIEEM